MIEKPTFLLSIDCITYNQSAYITDAMNGFIMQQTNFSFVAVIIDDASTDGEQEVIRKYVDEHFDHSLESGFKEWETEDALWTFAQHAENKNCHFVIVYLKRNLYKDPDKKAEVTKDWYNSKYIARCEGDDYWTDSLKLQKQVDFLEAHEEYSMCFHAAVINDDENEKEHPKWICCDSVLNKDYSATELFENWIVATASMVYRKDIVLYPIKNPGNILNGDIFDVEKCAHCGKVRAMEDRMSVYRIHSSGVTYDMARQKERTMRYPKHYQELKRNFPLINKRVVNYFIGKAFFMKGADKNNFFLKYMDFIIGSIYSPKYLFEKTVRIMKRRLKQ